MTLTLFGLGNERFAEATCARLGVRRNNGKRGRTKGEVEREPPPAHEQQGFGF